MNGHPIAMTFGVARKPLKPKELPPLSLDLDQLEERARARYLFAIFSDSYGLRAKHNTREPNRLLRQLADEFLSAQRERAR